MDLTRALKDVRFDLVMRGYDCDAVDAFLAKARGEVAEIISQRDAARVRVEELETSGESDAEGTLRRTLVLAQRLADETVADAKATAESMVASATTDASEAREQAKAEADTILREANDEAAEARTNSRQELERATEDAARVSEEAAVEAQRSRDAAVEQADQILADAEAAGQERVAALEREAKEEVARMREPIRAEIGQLEETRSSLLRDIEALEEHLSEQRVRVRTAVESLRAGMSGSIDDLERVAADEDAMSLAPRPALENESSAAVDAAPDIDIVDQVHEHAGPAPSAEAVADTVAAGYDDGGPPTELLSVVHDADDVQTADDDEAFTGPDSVADVDMGGPEDAVAEVVDLDAEPSAIFGTEVADGADVLDAQMVDVAEVVEGDVPFDESGDDGEAEVTDDGPSDEEIDDDGRPFLERFTAAIGELPIQRGG